MHILLRRKEEAECDVQNCVQVSIVTESNIILMWPLVTVLQSMIIVYETRLRQVWKQNYMCWTQGGALILSLCFPGHTATLTSERSNLFQSIVPSYKSWSPECVCASVCVCEDIPNTTYQSNQPNHTHPHTHSVSTEYLNKKKKCCTFTNSNFSKNWGLNLHAEKMYIQKNKHNSDTEMKAETISGHVRQL